MGKFSPKIFLVSWDFFRVPGNHFRHPRVLRYPDNFFINNLLSCSDKFNVLLHKIKGLKFYWSWSQFLLVNKLNRGRLGQNFLHFQLHLCLGFKMKCSKPQETPKLGVVIIKNSSVLVKNEISLNCFFTVEKFQL